jgi:hypothetical protein
MRFSRFLAELNQLIRFFHRQCIQIHAVNRFVEMHSGCAHIAPRPIALP